MIRLVKRIPLILFLAGWLTATLFSCREQTPAEGSQDLPNVVFIFTDDLGYGDLSGYHSRSRIQTPRIDQLAREGMTFTDAHTSSAVCTPSRYSLLTGRYCWRTEHKRGVQGGYGLPLIKPGQWTLGTLFQQKGYKTAAIGKWHVGMEWRLKPGAEGQESETVDLHAPLKITPVDQGFDYFFGTSGCTSDDPPFCFIENRRTVADSFVFIRDLNVVGDGDFVKDVVASPGWKHECADTTFTSKAIAFMEQQADRGDPFFVYLALSLQHIPWLPAEFVKGTTSAGPRGDLVALADYCVGRVDQALRRMGVRENTILVFSSDNGPREGINGHASAGRLRGLKGQIFEGGHRVPLIVRWPGQVEAGASTDETVCLTDFMATFSNLIDQRLPEGSAEDSYDLSPVLLQQPYERPLRASTVHHSGAGAFAIRRGKWKLIFGEVKHGEEPSEPSTWTQTGYLFNLEKDPYETTNVYDRHPEVVAEMNQLLREYGVI